ncbi:MAG: hypothetical protein QM723_03075 [Myxococcaceae bacterium]
MRGSIVLLAVVLAAGCKKGGESGSSVGNGAPARGQGESAPAEANNAGTGEAKKNPAGCNSDFAEDLQADYTLTAKCSPYTVKHALTWDGFNVTIEPGVEVRFADGQELTVGYNTRGKLIAKGTAEKPIVFTAADHKEAGSWRGLTLGGNAQDSVMEHVSIEYAGVADGDAFEVKAGGVALKNVKLSNIKGAGLVVKSETPLLEISGLDLSAVAGDRPLELPFNGAGALKAGNVFAKDAVIWLEPSQVEADLVVPLQAVAYRTHGETDVHGKDGKTAVVTIEAGVTLQMAEDAELDFGYEPERAAGLKASGTAEKPIRFVRFGDDQKTTPWKGLAFFGGARGPELDYVTFENGGRQDDAMLRFDNPKGLGKITHCSFVGSHGAGIMVRDARERFQAFDANTFKDNAQAAIVIPAELANGLGSGNSFVGDEWVEVKGDVHHDTTWAAVNAPYRVIGDINVEGGEAGKSASLTVAPGAKLVFGENAAINIGYSNPGKLTLGGAEKPIAISALQGKWNGIESFEKGSLEVQNAVVDGVADDKPAIRADSGAQGSVKNVTFKGKLGLKNCSDKVQSSGNKGAKDSKDGC